jgi:hypothetical protein
MGCDHWNDYIRAIMKVIAQYNGLPEGFGQDCPFCKLEALQEKQIIDDNYSPEAFHVGCGSYGSKLLMAEDGTFWEICAKCGDELREVTK